MVKVNWLEAVKLRLFWNYCFKTGRKGRVRRQRLAPRQAAAMEPRLLLSATAIDDQLNVQYDPATTSLELDVLANDTGMTGETLQLIDGGVATNQLTGAWGELEIRDNGVDPIAILYTPIVGYDETFSFQYQLSDGTNTSTATVQLNVQGELAPLTVGDAATVVAGGAVSIDPLANDSDPEGTALTVVSVTNGSSGTASLSRYIPPALASEYQGYMYDYPTIDDYVMMYYGSWNDYFQFYANPADDRMIVEYVSTDAGFLVGPKP